ncbi:MAG: tryptophan 7-halogenase [Planctomycetaceae bacterium]|nr:tryptophan 7-halogenase [Planctomycetaceae bacterium]
MAQELDTDVVVIGGGPAGAAFARKLAEFGHQIVILEKAAFPRPHVGICLSDATEMLLDQFNVRDAVHSAGFFRRKSVLVKWGTDQPLISDQPGLHVDRGVFDRILLESARRASVTTIQPGRFLTARRRLGGWQVIVENGQRTINLQSRFLVDASGRANAFPGQQVRYAPPLFALHATWRLCNRPDYDGIMESGKNAWMWIACLAGQEAQISVYTDPALLASRGKRSVGSYYESMLDEFSLIRHFHRDEILGEIQCCDASSRHSSHPVGADFLRVGDANLSLDPMASQGVHLALTSGIQAAIVVNTILCFPELALIAQRFYQERQEERVRQFRHRTASEYQRVACFSSESFWQERAINAVRPPPVHADNRLPLTPSQTLELSPHAQFLETPVMKSDRISLEPALHHPRLDRPVAFVGETEVCPLLRGLNGNHTVGAILAAWESKIPGNLGLQIIQWLWEHEVLVAR